jgi:aromatic ring-opening dioxygenase catalytic subunit (LigB family)
MTAPRPPMLYDYYGFPPESYTITWPAPGEPTLAARVREVLASAGLATAADADRGFDHGTFVPLKLAYPEADVPAFQLSLVRGLDPRVHLDLGANAAAAGFDAWLQEAMAQGPEERDRRLVDWERAPFAREAHPREEHLLPLMVAAGAAGADGATLAWSGTLNGHRLSAFHFGTA